MQYTATEDCWVVGYALANDLTTVNVTIKDGDYSAAVYTTMNKSGNDRHMFPLKKGQTLIITAGGFDFTFYGMY